MPIGVREWLNTALTGLGLGLHPNRPMRSGLGNVGPSATPVHVAEVWGSDLPPIHYDQGIQRIAATGGPRNNWPAPGLEKRPGL